MIILNVNILKTEILKFTNPRDFTFIIKFSLASILIRVSGRLSGFVGLQTLSS